MTRVNVLITGISGFTGCHLYRYLLAIPGLELYGLTRNVTGDLQSVLPQASLIQGDILDYEALRGLIESIRPVHIFHLAGQRPNSDLWDDQRDAFATNCIGTMALLEALRSADCSARVLIASSSAVYGVVDNDKIPIREDHAVSPINIYGVSKATQEIIGHQYLGSHGIEVMIARVFNCIGPGEGKEFASSNFADQLVQVKKGYREPRIEVGNLEPVRDYVDVRDVARAYWLIMERGIPGEAYNVCSEKGYSVKEILDMLIVEAGIRVRVVGKAARVRSADMPVSIGSYARLNRQTGWSPQIDIHDTLKELLAFWEQQSNSGGDKR